MMSAFRIDDYEVRISALSEEDGGGFVAIVPELPGCMSDAEALGRTIPAPKYYRAPDVSGNLALQG